MARIAGVDIPNDKRVVIRAMFSPFYFILDVVCVLDLLGKLP